MANHTIALSSEHLSKEQLLGHGVVFQDPQEVEPLLCLLDQYGGIGFPG